MEGITKKRLLEIANRTHDSDDTNRAVLSLLDYLLSECKELNPWLPIDENTPKDRWLLLVDAAKDQYIGKFDSEYVKWYVDIGVHVIPTHYQELPEAPL